MDYAGTALVLLEQIGEASGVSALKGVAGVGALIMELCDVSYLLTTPFFTIAQYAVLVCFFEQGIMDRSSKRCR